MTRARRSPLDFYETPRWQTQALLSRVTVRDVLEPCAGDLAIARVLRSHGVAVMTNDVDRRRPARWHMDATTTRAWSCFARAKPRWVVTNPPFSAANDIVPLALHYATEGVAMLLRLSWLEPTNGRQSVLRVNPPHQLIVLPRTAYRRRRKGKSRTDSVTTAWCVWYRHRAPRMNGIEIVTKWERDEIVARYRRAA